MARLGSRNTPPESSTQTSADSTTTPTPDGNPNLEGTPTEGDATGLTTEGGTQTPATTDNGLSADFLSAPVSLDMTAAPEYARQSQPVRARSAKQEAMDKAVQAAHEKWIAAGRPSVWGANITAHTVAYYFTPPEQAADLKKLVNRSRILHDLRIKWGSEFVATSEMVQRFSLPAEYEGRTVVSFVAMDKRQRAGNGAAVAAAQVAANGDDDDDDDDDE